MNRRLEHKTQSLIGRQWLYAHSYRTEDEIWAMYDHKVYETLRAKYDAVYLPTIYDKVKVDFEERAIRKSWVAWLSEIFWCIAPLMDCTHCIKQVVGGDYLLSRKVGQNYAPNKDS